MGALIGETTYVGDFKIYVEDGLVEITNTYSGIEFASGKLLDVKSELRELVRALGDLEK